MTPCHFVLSPAFHFSRCGSLCCPVAVLSRQFPLLILVWFYAWKRQHFCRIPRVAFRDPNASFWLRALGDLSVGERYGGTPSYLLFLFSTSDALSLWVRRPSPSPVSAPSWNRTSYVGPPPRGLRSGYASIESSHPPPSPLPFGGSFVLMFRPGSTLCAHVRRFASTTFARLFVSRFSFRMVAHPEHLSLSEPYRPRAMTEMRVAAR